MNDLPGVLTPFRNPAKVSQPLTNFCASEVAAAAVRAISCSTGGYRDPAVGVASKVDRTARALAPRPRPSEWTPGGRRAASDGFQPGQTTKPIEDVEIGDLVWAWDEVSASMTRRPVNQLFRHEDKPTLLVTCVSEGGARQTIEATKEHPFWIEGKGWVPTCELQPGDSLKGVDDGPEMRVYEVSDSGQRSNVYNFEVDGIHNYFVGETGVLVHNSSTEPPSNFHRPSISVNAERGVVVANFVHPEHGGFPAQIDADYLLNRYSHFDDSTATDLPRKTLYVLAHGNEAGPAGMGVLDGTLGPGVTTAQLLAGIGEAMDVASSNGIGVDQVLTGICGGGRGTAVTNGVSLGQLINDFVQPVNGTAAFDGLAHIDGRGVKAIQNRKLGAPYSAGSAAQLTPSRMTYIPAGDGTGYKPPFLDEGGRFDRHAPTLPPSQSDLTRL